MKLKNLTNFGIMYSCRYVNPLWQCIPEIEFSQQFLVLTPIKLHQNLQRISDIKHVYGHTQNPHYPFILCTVSRDNTYCISENL